MKRLLAALTIFTFTGCAGFGTFTPQAKTNLQAVATYWQQYSNGAVATIAKEGIAAVCPECMGPINLAIAALNAAASDILAGDSSAQDRAVQADKDLKAALAKAGK